MWRVTSVAWALAGLFFVSSAWADAKLVTVEKRPEGLSDAIAKALSPDGQQLVMDDEAILTVWTVKELAQKPDFKPSLNIKYPFHAGQLIGVLQVNQSSGFKDFRGQDVAGGVYTLRYGQQPVDGNHIGTSETYDFLLALPAAADKDPASLKSPDALFGKSAQTTGSNHPAIFSLIAPEAGQKAPELSHDENKEFWILSLSATATGGKSLPIRLIVIGVSEG